MKLITNLAIRNLFRQKRRNLLLGIVIGFGMMILVIANSFSHGLSDMLLNKFMVYAFGHVQVNVIESGHAQGGVIRDQERMESIIRANVKDLKEINQALSAFCRAVGNGKADQAALVGLKVDNETLAYFQTQVVSGTVWDYTNRSILNPLVVYEAKAKALNVKVGDSIGFRMRTIYGQQQSVKGTVVAIMKGENIMSSMAIYIPLDIQKELLGYAPYESGNLQINLSKMNNPTVAMLEADRLHAALKPNLAAYYGNAQNGGRKSGLTVFSFFTNTNAAATLTNQLKLVRGSYSNALTTNSILVSETLAKRLGLSVGSPMVTTYTHKFDSNIITNRYRVAGIYQSSELLGAETALVAEQNFYKNFRENLPVMFTNFKEAFVPVTNSAIYPALATEWVLLPRSKDFMAYQKKMQEIRKQRWEGTYLNVSTLYEVMSMVIQVESALNMITMIAVFILFIVILVGVINTLRMTVRERTREIGTMRAIGMQRDDVRGSFILETCFLTLASTIAGTVLAFIVMGLLSLLKLNVDGIFSMLLWKNHLYFMPTIGKIGVWISQLVIFALGILLITTDDKLPKKLTSFLMILLVIIAFFVTAGGPGILTNLTLILFITMVTAFFPSRRAADLSASEALRHYE